MKLVVAADFHISEDRRFQDTVNLLQYILEQVSRIHPEHLVILGDIFDKRKPTPREMQLLNKWLFSMRTGVVDRIILLEGNHDLDRDVSALSYLHDLAIDKVQIVRPPYKLDRFYFDHLQLIGALADNGFAMSEGQSLASIVQKNPDCHTFAFGHLHKPQILQERISKTTTANDAIQPFAFYAGSLDKVTFSEAEDVKRLWVFNNATLEGTINLPTRPMYQFNIAVTETESDISPWAALDLTGAMLKIVFSGTREALKGIDSARLHTHLYAKGIFSLKVILDITDKSAPRNEIINESVSEHAALEEYFKDHADKANLVTHGLQIIKEIQNG